jgi:fosfomycin resistance protein FosX
MPREGGSARQAVRMIKGLSHITLVVRDLEKSVGLMIDLFGAEEVYSSGDATHSLSREKFFLIKGLWVALMEGEPLPGKTYDHIAFRIEPGDIDFYLEKIHTLGLEIREGRNRSTGEGASIYFYDYDNHLFELHAGTLEERLGAYDRPE